jgi:hypothetical protein
VLHHGLTLPFDVTSSTGYAHTSGVQTPGHRPVPPRRARRGRPLSHHVDELWALTGQIAALSGLVLVLSTFMDWYVGSGGEGVVFSVTGWQVPGALGKLTCLVGLAVLLLLGLRRFGIVLPASLPESLVLIGLGVLAVVLVLFRIIWVPLALIPSGRGIGLWIALLAALGVIVAGVLETADEL